MQTYFYATGDFDRSAQRREDQTWLKARLIDPHSRFYPVWRLRHLVGATDNPVVGSLDPVAQAELIARAAVRKRCDLVLMGSRGHGPIRQALLGSIAAKVIARSTVPVLVAR